MRNKLIGFIIAAICAMLLITLYICYYQSKYCFRHFKRKFQNPAHTTPPSNQTVRIVTGNEQPMTWNFSTQEYSSPSQMQPPYYGQQSAFNPGKNKFLKSSAAHLKA